jgi:peptidoglycan/LPS O-acetylase OafA/YrhL
MVDAPIGGGPEAPPSGPRRRTRLARTVTALVIVGALVVVVVQNSQPVTLRFWFIVTCLVIAGAIGYVAGRRGLRGRRGRRRRHRPAD